MSRLVWNLCYAWLGVSLVDHLDPTSHFMQFKLLDAPTSINLILGSIWVALVSDIWRHRNNCIYKGGVLDHFEIFSSAQLKVWSWVSSKFPSVCFSFSDWCLEPLVCIIWLKACGCFRLVGLLSLCCWGVLDIERALTGRRSSYS